MRNLGVAIAFTVGVVGTGAQTETQLWEHVPETIAPEWDSSSLKKVSIGTGLFLH